MSFVVCFALLLIFLNGCDANSKSANQKTEFFLQKYFRTLAYEISTNQMQVEGANLFLACNFADKQRRIVKKAVLFEVGKTNIIGRFYIDGEKILNSNGECVLNLTGQYSFFGWRIRWESNDSGLSSGLELSFYSKNGESVADSLYFEWIPALKIFREVIPDPGMWE
jgi:hypothetical protein